MKKSLWLLVLSSVIIICIGIAYSGEFRIHEKTHVTELASDDAVLIEDYSLSYATRYTTIGDIDTYFFTTTYAPLGDLSDSTITTNFINTAYPWADNETANTLTVTAQSGSTWNLADSITLLSVYSGTTSLEEYTSASDSGAYIIGVYDEFENSTNHNIQAVLNDFDTALDARCLESVFGVSLSDRLSLNGTALDVCSTLYDLSDDNITIDLENTAYPWLVTEGGTGSGNATGARTNLGAAASGANSDITSLAGLTTPLTVPQGGMGATTFTDGGILLGSGTGAITALGAATNGQIPIGDGTTDPVLATLTGTANEVTVTNGAGAITLSMATGVNATKIGDGTVSSTEYQYIGTLTSNAQDQLDARCLESVFGIAIGTGLLLDTATLKVSAILQKYHGVDPSTDVLTMLGSDNSTVILSNIGAEPALTDEDSLYSTLSDVSQFYEPGDNVTTAHGTSRPTTCSVGQTFVDTDEDTDGLLCTCVAENTWKCGQSALSGDIISEDDSSVEVVDDNVTEQVVVTVSGTQIGLFDANGLDITGTITADAYEMDATASPRIRFLDSDCPGTDKFIGSIDYQYVDGADGAENGDIYIRSQEGGANTTQIQYDESDTSWEIPTGKNLVLDGGYVVGAARIGTEISANATLTTSQQRAIVYKASAACTVTLDAAADVGYGYIVGFKVKDASETLILRPEGGEIVNLHGTALAAGTGIQSPGNAGDFIFLMAVTDANATTDGYETWGYGEEAWTSE